MKKIIFLLFICISSNSGLLAQKSKIDSLTLVLKNFQPACSAPCLTDSHKVNTLIALGWLQLMAGDWRKTNQTATEALTLSEQIKFEKGVGNAHNLLGIAFTNTGDYPKAIKHQSQAISIYTNLGFKRGMAGSYNNTGSIYTSLGKYPEALKNFYNALRINEETGNKAWTAINYRNISHIYVLLGKQVEALKNYELALKILLTEGDLMNIAGCRLSIGSIYAKTGDYEKALVQFDTALSIYSDLEYIKGIASVFTNKAISYYYQGKYAEALIYYKKALSVAEPLENKELMALYSTNLGDNYVKLKKYKEAKHYLRQGLSIALEIGNLETLKDTYSSLAALDSATGNWQSAFQHQKLFYQYNDSLDMASNREILLQEKMTFDFEKKEAIAAAKQEKKDVIAHEEIKRQRTIRNSIIVGLGGALFFLLIVFRQRNRVKKEKHNVEQEKARSEALLLNILPAEIAEELKQSGNAVARQYNNVSVLFTDFVNFTGISEHLSPTELVAEIHKNFTAFDAIMEKHGLEKIKTIGDAYLAVCGLPIEAENHAQKVVQAALEICSFIEQSISPFQVRIGINSGPVVAGIVGVKKYAYDIWGDTVNTAARMEQSSEPGRINISGSTYELVKDNFVCSHRGKITAKNKGEIDMYFVN